MKKVSVTVNGHVYTRTIDDSMTLLSFLRDVLGLTGTKEGCGEGTCGACSVLVNEKLVNSCLYLAVETDGKRVMTVEGLERGDGAPHPLQKAFVEAGAIQCGFCTPGMLMAAAALLHENPNPTEEEIKLALSGNLCRCTGYEKIIEAVKRASRDESWSKNLLEGGSGQ